jgi:hypothetical protein
MAKQIRLPWLLPTLIQFFRSIPPSQTNDQTAYGRLGAEALFKKLGGKGNVVEMRGIDGVPADADRHEGFTEALKKYPNIKVVGSVFTGWSPDKGAQETKNLALATSGERAFWLIFYFSSLRECPVCAATRRRNVCKSIADFHERSNPSS